MGRSLYERYRSINLSEIQLNEIMSQSHRTESLSKGIKKRSTNLLHSSRKKRTGSWAFYSVR